jgi:hypothetical protein
MRYYHILLLDDWEASRIEVAWQMRILVFLDSQAYRPAPTLFRVFLDIILRVLDDGDFLGILIGNCQLKLFFERHDQLHEIERVGIEIFDKGSGWENFAFLDPKLFDDNLDETLMNG